MPVREAPLPASTIGRGRGVEPLVQFMPSRTTEHECKKNYKSL
jgi:hypothetical protein